MAVEGVKELMRKFEKLGAAGQTKVLRAACRGAGAVVRKQARANIPVGSEPHRLHDGTLVTPGFARKSIVARVFVNKSKGTVSVAIGVRAKAFYAVQFVEMERGNSRSRGKPWLRPAFETTEDQQRAQFERRFREVINKVVRS